MTSINRYTPAMRVSERSSKTETTRPPTMPARATAMVRQMPARRAGAASSSPATATPKPPYTALTSFRPASVRPVMPNCRVTRSARRGQPDP
jgi:hypothetical protein